MFVKLVALTCLLGAVLGAPPERVPIVEQNSDVQPDGSFMWNFESGDGTKQEQSGSFKVAKDPEEEPSLAVKGEASWTDPEGNQHELKYVADKNGFQPQGADIPASIARALAWNAAHLQEQEASEEAKNKLK